MAYLVKLGEIEAARGAATAKEARQDARKEAPASWWGDLFERRFLALALLGVIVLCSGVITAYGYVNRPAVIAVEDPHSAQELADDDRGTAAVSANGEVADDSK